MSFLLLGAIGQFLLKLILSLVAVFLIMLILVQRGRGGGLAGAFGGAGGSSAFGAKAGDIFTKITMWAAGFWIILCLVAATLTPEPPERLTEGGIGSSGQPAANLGPSLGAPPSDEEDSDEPSDSTATESAGESEEVLEADDSAGETPATDQPADDAASSDSAEAPSDAE